MGSGCNARIRDLEDGCPGTHYVIDVNHVSLTYLDAGSGKPVVLLHGNGGSHLEFRVMIGQLVDAGYRVIAPDTRGHGANDPLPEYHYADMAQDVYELVNALGLDEPAVYGWSDGGIVALLLEVMHPHTTSLLAISGANFDTSALDDAFVEEITAEYAVTHDPLLALMLNEPNMTTDDLAGIDVPVFVMAGEFDVVPRDHTELIAQSIQDSTLVIVEGKDHYDYVVGSPVVGELVMGYLTRQGY